MRPPASLIVACALRWQVLDRGDKQVGAPHQLERLRDGRIECGFLADEIEGDHAISVVGGGVADAQFVEDCADRKDTYYYRGAYKKNRNNIRDEVVSLLTREIQAIRLRRCCLLCSRNWRTAAVKNCTDPHGRQIVWCFEFEITMQTFVVRCVFCAFSNVFIFSDTTKKRHNFSHSSSSYS